MWCVVQIVTVRPGWRVVAALDDDWEEGPGRPNLFPAWPERLGGNSEYDGGSIKGNEMSHDRCGAWLMSLPMGRE